VQNVQFLLSVVTSVDILLLGVNFLDSNGWFFRTNAQKLSKLASPLGIPTENFPNAEMHLVSEPLFKCSLDNMIVADIKSTNEGQIFLAGRDGCLYEIRYQVCT